jgi:ATP-dependent Lon protease
MAQNEDWNDDEEEDVFNVAISQRTEELYRIPNHTADETGIIEALVLPMRDLVVFPHMVSPVFVDNEAAILTLQTAHERNQTVIGLTQKDPENATPKPVDFLSIGVEIAVGRLLSMPDGNSSALVQGRRRVEVLAFTRLAPYIKVRARVIEEPTPDDKKTQALMRSALSQFERCVQLNRSIPEEAHLFAINIAEPGWLADMIATSVSVSFEERQKLLLMLDPKARLERVNELLANELDVLELEDEIHTRVQSEVARVLPARTNEGYPDRVGRRRRLHARRDRATPEARTGQTARGGQGHRAQRDRASQPDAANGARSRHHPHLPGLDPGPAVE